MYASQILRAALLLALATAAAEAAPSIVNGGFDQSSYTGSSQFGTGFGGQGVTGWTGNGGYELYFVGGTGTTVSAASQYGGGREKLYGSASFTGASPDGGNFIALDGDPSIASAISQTVTGLTVGNGYTIGFDWGAGQLQSRSGDTTEQLGVTFGGTTFSTAVVSNPSQSFTGWFHQAFTYTATSTSEVLSFLSEGTPVGLPPVAVLDGVTITAAPEPVSLSLLGAGLAGLGLLRRRAK